MKADWKLQNASSFFACIRKNPKQRVCRNILLVLLLFFCFTFLAEILQVITASCILLGLQIAGIPTTSIIENVDARLILSLYLTSICIAISLVFCLGFEKRSVGTMFLTRRKLIPDYLIGALLGFAMMGAVVLIAWFGGAIRFEGIRTVQHPILMILLFIGWMIQGFSEELSFRGWLMTSIGTHHSVWAAVAISAVSFAVMHCGNDGFSIFAVINLILFGIVTALYVLRTGSIWGAAAMHSIWNWAQGNFFGMQVSGIPTGSTVLQFSQSGKSEWIGGGTFGLEAGCATTIVLLIVAVILLMSRRQTFNKEDEANETI